MQDEDYSQPLMNALPPAVAALALAIFSVEMVFMLGARGIIGGPEAIGWRGQAIQDFSFFPPLIGWLFETGNWASPEMLRFVTYPFVHFSFTQAIFVVVFLLALGKLVGEAFGNLAVLILFFVCGAFGALVFAGLVGSDYPLAGGFPSVYGLIGAYTFLLWVGLGAQGQNQAGAFSLIAMLMAIQLVFGLIFGSNHDWVAEVAGFAMGFVLTPALAPGAFRRFVSRVRQR